MSAAENTAEDAGRKASGSSFYAAMRILPKTQRAAMYEIYAFCRAVDDIADDPGPVRRTHGAIAATGATISMRSMPGRRRCICAG